MTERTEIDLDTEAAGCLHDSAPNKSKNINKIFTTGNIYICLMIIFYLILDFFRVIEGYRSPSELGRIACHLQPIVRMTSFIFSRETLSYLYIQCSNYPNKEVFKIVSFSIKIAVTVISVPVLLSIIYIFNYDHFILTMEKSQQINKIKKTSNIFKYYFNKITQNLIFLLLIILGIHVCVSYSISNRGSIFNGGFYREDLVCVGIFICLAGLFTNLVTDPLYGIVLKIKGKKN